MSEQTLAPYGALDLDGSLIDGSLLPKIMEQARRERKVRITGSPYEDVIDRELRHLGNFLQGASTRVFDNAISTIPDIVRRKKYPFVDPLIEALNQNGLRVVVATQSPLEWAQVAAQEIGGIDHVVGSTLVRSGVEFTGEVIALNKTHAMGQLAIEGYEAAPRFSAGNTVNDLPMLIAAVENGGAAIAICLTDIPEMESHRLHKIIHDEALPIPIVGYDSTMDELLVCEKSLVSDGSSYAGLACRLMAVGQSDFMDIIGVAA